jgi:NitT/TauT family transport system substrate-binding protein
MSLVKGPILASCLAAVWLGVLPDGSAAAAKNSPVAVQLRWTHQSQFAGFYAAEQLGHYAAAGLQVSFVEGGPKADLVAPVVEGRAQFGVAGADALLVARSQGSPVRALATIYRRSPVVFFALADSGIARPRDFIGKVIHVPQDLAPTFRAIMSRARIREGQYQAANFGTDLSLLQSGKVHVWGGLISGKAAFTVQKDGHRLHFIYPDDYGLHFYADTLFTTEGMIEREPDLVLRFVRATLLGWTHAVENPGQVPAMVLKHRPDADPEYEAASMTASLPLINTGEDHIGWMRPEVWAGMEETLFEQGVLPKRTDAAAVYTHRFLRAIYGR